MEENYISYLRDSQKKHQGFMLASIIFLIVCLLLKNIFFANTTLFENQNRLLQIIFLFISFTTYLFQRIVYRRKLKKWYYNRDESILQKQNEFLKFAYFQWQITVLPIFLGGIFYLGTNKLPFWFFAFFFVFVLALQIPSKLKMSVLLRCKKEDIK